MTKHLHLVIEGDEETILKFARLALATKYLCQVGASRYIATWIDGDGPHVEFEIVSSDIDSDDILVPVPNKCTASNIVFTTPGSYRSVKWIGGEGHLYADQSV